MKKTILFLAAMSFAFSSCAKADTETSEEPAPPRLLHSAYTLTEENLPELTKGLPGSIVAKINEKPEYFLQLVSDITPWATDLTILVNKETGLTDSYIPEDIVQLDDYSSSLLLSRGGHRLRAVVLPSLLAMTEAASQEGLDLMISSCYRSYEYQEGLYNRYVERDGKEAADRYSAQPGKSQHQLGTVIDFGSIDNSFAETASGRWLKENAWHFGFSLSYPEGMESYTGYMWESWHYRYIGRDAAVLQKDFFEGSQERMLRFLNEKSSFLEAAFTGQKS